MMNILHVRFFLFSFDMLLFLFLLLLLLSYFFVVVVVILICNMICVLLAGCWSINNNNKKKHEWLKSDYTAFSINCVTILWAQHECTGLFLRKQRLCAVSEKLTFLSHWKHIVLLLLWLYTNNTRPFAVSNDALFVFVRSKMMQYL